MARCAPFALACLVLLVAVVGRHSVGAQATEFSAAVTRSAARHIRLPLPGLMPSVPFGSNTTRVLLRLREKGLPAAPEYLALRGDSIAGPWREGNERRKRAGEGRRANKGRDIRTFALMFVVNE